MALTSADLARLGPKAQKQLLDKLAGAQKPKRSKYGNRKVVCDGIKFDSEREAARFTKKCGVDLSAVSHSVSAMRQNPQKKRRFASVWTAWSDREYAKYFGEVPTC